MVVSGGLKVVLERVVDLHDVEERLLAAGVELGAVLALLAALLRLLVMKKKETFRKADVLSRWDRKLTGDEMPVKADPFKGLELG